MCLYLTMHIKQKEDGGRQNTGFLKVRQGLVSKLRVGEGRAKLKEGHRNTVTTPKAEILFKVITHERFQSSSFAENWQSENIFNNE